MSGQCDRSAAYVKMLGRGCPNDAQPVVLRKARGDVSAVLCSEHVKAYRSSGVRVEAPRKIGLASTRTTW